MWTRILELAQYIVPAGCLGAIVHHLVFPRFSKAKDRSNEEAVYKLLYNDLKIEVVSLQQEYQDINLRLHTIERKIYEAVRCEHFSAECPLFSILQDNPPRVVSKQRERGDVVHGADPLSIIND